MSAFLFPYILGIEGTIFSIKYDIVRNETKWGWPEYLSMERRAVLSSVVAGAAWTAGCIGGGSDVVTTLQRDVVVSPGQGWVKRIPDVSGSGGAIQYKARASQPFDVYLFTGEAEFMFYDTYLDGGKPARKPSGHGSVGATARQVSEGSFEATTPDDGAREPIDAEGPYFFVVDHSDYGDGPAPGDDPSPLSVFLDMTVTERTLL